MKNKLVFGTVIAVVFALFFMAFCLFANTSFYSANAEYNYSDTDIFEINSTEDFYSFYDFAVTEKYGFTGKTIRLNADIDGSKLDTTKGKFSSFGGTFDGNGHTVYSLRGALFSYITQSGIVKDVEFANVDLYGYGVAEQNGGLISNVSVSGTMRASTQSGGASGIVATNGANGKIENCSDFCEFVSAFRGAKFSGVASSNMGLIKNSVFSGKFVAEFSYNLAGISWNNTGSIENSVVMADYDLTAGEGTQGIDYFYAIAKDTGNVGSVSNTVAFINNSAPSKRINICNGTVNAVQAVIVVNGEKRFYDTADGTVSLTAETLGFENLPKNIFEGNGTEEEPFLISNFSDLRKLKISSAIGDFFYKLNADIDLKDREVITSFDNFTYYGGTVYGKGHALWNGGNETVFSSDFSLTGENIGFVFRENDTLSGNTSDGYIDWNTDFGKTDTSSAVASGQLAGNGTKADPYLIDSAESLKAMDGLTGYALVTKDIAVNDFSATQKLAIYEIKAEINGNGKVISGLIDEPLCETLSGKIYNLTLRRAGSSVCKTLSGSLKNLTILGTGTCGLTEKNDGEISDCTVYGEYESAFFAENNGTLTKSVNDATAEKVFSYDGTGTIENSVNYYAVTENHSDGVDFSFDFGNSCYFIDGEKTTVSEFDYPSLKTAGFDFNEVFGYEKGSDKPTLREFTRDYKTEIKVIVNNFSSLIYSAERSYYLSQINRAVTTTEGDIYDNTEFSWTYDGEPFTDNAEEVGIYELTARYGGNDDYLPSVEKMSFSIRKADFEEFEPIFAEGDFADITETYSGEYVKLSTPVPTNTDELSAYGFTQSFLLKQDGKTISGGLNVGSYEYCAVFSSKNYNDIVISVNLKIEKKELFIKVRDAVCDYNSAFDTTKSSAFIVDGLTERDANQTVEGLAQDYANGFSTDYKVGDGVGDYAITFEGVADNYFFTVTNGTLHIRAIPIPLDIIDFYGATLGENGNYSVEYSGEPVLLTANYPDYVTVTYSDNSFVDVCNETVSATFEIDENYEKVVLRVNLEIYKATVTVKAPSLSVTYGKEIDFSDLTAEVTGLKANETDIFEEFSFECYDGETLITGIYNAGTYSVKTAVQAEPKNYRVEYEDGILTIEKASLKNYRTAIDSETFVDDEKIYDGESAERIVDFFDETEAEIIYSITKGGSPVEEIKNAGIYTVVAKVIPLGDLALNYKETEYSCTYTVKKKSYDLQFSQSRYDFVYGGISYADITNFPYSGLEEGAETVFIIKKDDSTVNDILHFGTYDITVIFNETENENSAQATAKVTVAKKDAEVSIQDRYDYIGERIEPVVISVTGGINEELTADDLRFGYRNITGLPVSYIRNAGRYYVDISLANEDYRLLKTEYEVTVDKAVVPFEIGTITYPYGTQGETDINGTNMIISENSVYIPSYRYGEGTYEVTIAVGKNADTYVITDKDITDMPNFDFIPNGENKVIITRRALTLSWRVDGNDYANNAYTTLYLGEEQKSRFDYRVQNLVYGETQEELSLSLTVNGSDSISVYDVGEYLFEVKLTGSLNYTLGNSPFTVTVEKAKLLFSVNDAEVYQWESFRLSYEVSGAVGNDKNKSVSTLKGAQIRSVTSYNENSPVNSVHTVSVRASFFNYDVEVVREGTITVVTNPYDDYLAAPYWKDTVLYTYTGKNITVEINNLPEGVTAVYSNNIQRDAGTYTVSATVTYPTGRQKSATCLLTIVSANPTVSVDETQMLFIENYTLTEKDLHGVATFNGEEIEGDFIPDEGQILTLGSAQYEFTFLPRDTKNFNTVKGTFEITSASITLADFTFDSDKFNLNADGVLIINAELKMDFHPPIDGLTLCRNGSEVEYVLFDKSETVAVTVTLGDNTAFEMTFIVVLEEKAQPVVIDVGVLDLTSVRVSGKNIFVSEGGGRMSVNAKHKDSFLLYVDGYYYDEFIFDGNEKEVAVTIVLKSTGKPVFSETYNVSVERIEQEKKSYTLYYVIGGSVLGVIAIVAVVLFIWKKRNG